MPRRTAGVSGQWDNRMTPPRS